MEEGIDIPSYADNETIKSTDETIAPEDKYNLVFIIIFLFGVGVLFPWNAFVSAMDYFKLKYPNFPMEFGLPSFYNFPNLIFLIINIRWGHHFSLMKRIFFGFAVLVFVFIGVPLLDVIPLRNDLSQWILLIFAALCGFANGILFGALFGLAAMFPSQYTTALMSGNGLAGVIIFVLRSITKVSYEGKDPNGGRKSSILYFSMTCVVLFVCLIGVFAIRLLRFSKYYMSIYAKKSNKEKESLINGPKHTPEARYRNVIKKIWVQGMNAFFCFFVSLSLFPGLTYKIPPSTPKLDNGWIGILLVGMFQVFDLIGRTVPKWTLFISPKWLWPCNLARSVFFILFPLCIIPLGDPYIKSNVWAILFMIIFSLTNGYFGTLAMVYGPMEVEEHEKQVAGNLMSLFLQTGIFLGVHFALFMLFCVDPEALYKMFT